jgi:hypothetical protein
VQKVLVDGEEFFGDDPTMATQNIAAKAVDKVQVFDTKSEQQQITGITNNADGKTVNIKLKENSKKGYFGKAYAGTDFDKYVDAKLLYNNFVGKKKFSVYGTKSNVSGGGLNWEDRQKLGIENDFEYDEINGYYFSFGSGDEFSDWNIKGLPDSYSAGALYSNKWNDDNQSLNGSYRFNQLGTSNTESILQQNILANTVNYNNKYINSSTLHKQHAFNGKYEWKIDSLASLKFVTADLYKTGELASGTNSEYLNYNKEYINRSNQERQNTTYRTQSDNQLTYKQMFLKKDRLWLTTARFGYTQDDQNGINTTHTEFYNNNVIDSVSDIDQMRKIYGESRTVGIKSTFSEPLNNKMALVIDYAYNQNNSVSDRNTYNKTPNGKYESLDTVYSNNFDLIANSHSGSAILKYMYKNLRFAMGSGISSVMLKLNNKDNNTHTTYNFTRITPQAQMSYSFKPQTRLSFTYRGTTQPPNISQLQPVRDNNDPLDVTVGNPNLKVGFNHNFNAFYNQFKMLSGTGIWINGSFNFINNAVTNSVFLDTTTGKQVNMPVNVNGVQNWNFWGQWNKGMGEKKLSKGLRFNGNGGRGINFINGIKNITDYEMIQFGPSLSYDYPDKYNFYISPELGYNYTRSSLNPNQKNKYFSLGGWMNGFIVLPGKFELNTDMNLNLQQKINGFTPGLNQIIWNAGLAKKVFKDKSGKIIFSVNDILDQNKGFSRVINSNFVSEDRFSRISRYFMLKFEWTFNKMPGATK